MSNRRMVVAGVIAVLIGVLVWWLSGALRSSSKPKAVAAASDGGAAVAADEQAGVWRAPRNADLDPAKTDPTGELRLEGQVIDEKQQGVGGATVVISSSPVRIVVTEDDGSFAFDGLLARTYWIGAVNDGNRSDSVNVRLRDDTEPVILRMHPGITLAVTVIDRDTQAPIAGATVTVSTLLEQSAVTDAAGVAELRGIGSGRQRVEVEAEGYAPRATSFRVPDDPGGRFEQTAEIARGAPVSGLVLTPDGNGQPEAWVYGRSASGDGNVRTQAGADGAWSIPAVSAGEWVFTSPGERFAPGESEAVTVDGKTAVDGVVIQVAPGYSILGVVVDAAGQPVPNAHVGCYADRGRGGGSATTDEHGAFDVFGLPPGKYEISASDGDRAAKPTDVAVTNADATGVTLTIVEATIRGTVVDSAGEPVAEAKVSAMPESTFSFLDGDTEAITDSSGRFTLGPFSADSYTISANWPEGGDDNNRYTRARTAGGRDSTTAKPGDHAVKIVLPAAATIRGTVVSSGAPVSRYSLTVSEGDRRDSMFANPKVIARADGTFERAGLPPATYTVTISGDDFETEHVADITVKAGEVKDLGTIEVRAGRTVRGVVVDAADAPVAGATVAVATFFSSRGGGIGVDDPRWSARMNARQGRTGADGRFELRGISTDSERPLQILADKRGIGRSRQITLPEGDAELTIRLETTGAIEVTVTGSKDRAMVTARLIDGETDVAGSNGYGSNRIEGLVPGRYQVTAMTYEPMRTSPPVEVTVVGGQTVTATVAFPTDGVTVVLEPRGKCEFAVLLRPGASANPENFDPSNMVATSQCKDKTPVDLENIPPGDYEACGGTEFKCETITVTATPARQTFKVW